MIPTDLPMMLNKSDAEDWDVGSRSRAKFGKDGFVLRENS